MKFISDSIGFAVPHAVVGLLLLAPVFAALVLLECVGPCIGSRPSWASRVRTLTPWVFFAVGGAFATIPVSMAIGRFGPHPLLPSWDWGGSWGFVAGGIAGILFGDFCYYWLHRFQHRFLWRLHSVHHSVREMSGVSAYHHWSETPIQGLFWGLPVAFLTPYPWGVPFFGGLAMAWGHVVHSPIKARIPGLVDNRFHRIHHSLEPAHFDRNFGVIVPWWDWLFGTIYQPKADEWPDVGLKGFDASKSIAALVFPSGNASAGLVRNRHIEADNALP